MPKTRLICLLSLLVLGVLAPSAAAAGLAATQRALAREMAASGAASGAYVADLDTGAPIYAYNPDIPRIPASVNKLFTTSTALTRFGPDHRLQTEVLADIAPDETGVVAGNLYLRGGGDPTFGAAQVNRLASRLAADGMVSVRGRVIGDESAWDGARGGPSSGYQTDYWVGPLSALTYNKGMDGRHFQKVPPRAAAAAFTRALRRAGITVKRAARAGVAPPEATSLLTITSPTIAQIVARTNSPSDNFYAESLLKALGREFGLRGSTASGATVVRATVAKMGAKPHLVDGSGLSRRDKTTPHDVVDLISSMDRSDVAAPFEASLPVAGRTGTLYERMRKTAARDRCHAKTGTLSDVSALAGYCDSRRGRRVAFAFLMNRANITSAHTHQDRMTSALARYG
jgi:serine-type D-Ala-D-Ala carboxypeptidase/endopeptidase (penicillin-binding protein 4)